MVLTFYQFYKSLCAFVGQIKDLYEINTVCYNTEYVACMRENEYMQSVRRMRLLVRATRTGKRQY